MLIITLNQPATPNGERTGAVLRISGGECRPMLGLGTADVFRG